MTNRERFRRRLRALFSRISTRLSPSRSSRHGAKIRGVVIHTTESPEGSLIGVVNYLRRPDVGVSSHYVVGDLAHPGEEFTPVVRLVPEKEKAWTAKSANSYFVQYELVGRASRTRRDWVVKYRTQLETVAALVADDVLQYGVPVQHAVPGIVGHRDLTKWGYPNDHTDPGPNFPWDLFLEIVRDYVRVGNRPEVRETVRTQGGGGHVAA
jgi:N-acetyl-anhydromuramyl-L-alanine amidase AmpD